MFKTGFWTKIHLSDFETFVFLVRINNLVYSFYTASRLMHKFNAHGATDITGFGLLGHAKNLAGIQKNEVSFVIHNLPIIAKMAAISKACGNMFGLLQGQSAETSGNIMNWAVHVAHSLYGWKSEIGRCCQCIFFSFILSDILLSCFMIVLKALNSWGIFILWPFP